PSSSGLQEPPSGDVQEPPSSATQDPSASAAGESSAAGGLASPPGAEPPAAASTDGGLQQLGETVAGPKIEAVPPQFYTGFAVTCAVILALLAWYYWRMDGEQFEILRMLVSSVMPLGILTLVVLGVILFGITTATE